jgi:hypothetical protein
VTFRLRGVQSDDQVGVAREHVSRHLFDAAPLALLFHCFADLVGQCTQHLLIRPEQFDLDWFVRPGQVAQLVRHDLDQFDLELVFCVLVFDLVLDLLHHLR